MTNRWNDSFKNGKSRAQDRATALSAGARDAAAGASERVGAVYGQVRGQLHSAVAPTRERAEHLLDAGTAQMERLATASRSQIDRAALASRGLIAERPLTAVVVGLGAGLLLGLLANRLAKTKNAAETDEEYEDSQD